MASFPDGFGCFVANLGIKDDSDDVVVIAADDGCSTSGVFTKSRFAGPSVELSRERVADGCARAIVVVSKNANVATGDDGPARCRRGDVARRRAVGLRRRRGAHRLDGRHRAALSHGPGAQRVVRDVAGGTVGRRLSSRRRRR
ncbi:MAG: bifunctional ornithine acetyltransferase/N-acetylglutamate synthase [Ilumatobacteraceae bacterium]